MPEQLPSSVVAALENPKYDWRTAEAVSRESGMDLENVRALLENSPRTIVRSSVPDEHGRSLYTTRKHYRETHGIGARLLSALADRVA
jgi:succinyl-CoA synthetase beta subunit